MSDYGEYNGETVHDMWVDHSYEMWTGENVTGNNNCGIPTQPKLYVVPLSQKEQSKREINICKSRIGSHKARLLQIELDIKRIESELNNSNLPQKRISHLQTLLAAQRKKYDTCKDKLCSQEAKLKKLLFEDDVRAIKSGNLKVVVCCLSALLLAFLLFWCIY